MYIVDPNAEDRVDEVRQKIEGIITGREGSMVSFEKLGKKRLAYPIDKRQYGIYFLVNFEGDGRIIQAVEHFLLLNPITIRHIVLAFTAKEVSLLDATKRIQLEEAERMRMGGRPLNAEGEALDVKPYVVKPKTEDVPETEGAEGSEGLETAVSPEPPKEESAASDDAPAKLESLEPEADSEIKEAVAPPEEITEQDSLEEESEKS